MTYQINFPSIPAKRPRAVLNGILGMTDLGQFVLGRIPSTKPASTAAQCPYRPFHAPDNGQGVDRHLDIGTPIFSSKPSALVPSYPLNANAPDTNSAASELPAMVATQPQLPGKPPALTTSNISMPPVLTMAAPAAIVSEESTSPYLPKKAVDGAMTYNLEPPVLSQSLPAKDKTTGESLPGKTVECR